MGSSFTNFKMQSNIMRKNSTGNLKYGIRGKKDDNNYEKVRV